MDEHRAILAINGSHRAEKGITEIALRRFLEGVESANVEYDVIYPFKMKIMPCDSCGKCLFETPGQCKYHDDMQSVIAKMDAADLLVLACPIYFDSMPSMMKKMLERLRSTLTADFEFRNGRTYHAKIHPKQHKAVTIFTAGNAEDESFVSISRIFTRIVDNMGGRLAAEFRFPSSHLFMTQPDLLTGQLNALGAAGKEFAAKGLISDDLLKNAHRAYFDDPVAVTRDKTRMILEMRETKNRQKAGRQA